MTVVMIILPLQLRLDNIRHQRSGRTTHDLAHLAVHQLIPQKSTSSSTGCRRQQTLLLLLAIRADSTGLLVPPILIICICRLRGTAV
jgi:hypothetical protein